MTDTPAGWYPDSSRPGTLRYWDGQRWTDHVAPVAPQPSPAAPLVTTPDGEPLAGWWWRALAYLIDTVIVGVGGSILTFPLQLGIQRELLALNDEFIRQAESSSTMPDVGAYFNQMLAVYQNHAVLLFAPGLVIFIAYALPLLRWKGATVGKLVCGLRVRRRDAPGQLPWSTILVRITVQYLIIQVLVMVAFLSGSWVTWIACAVVWTGFALLDPLWAAADPKKQALHDKAARTNVVRTR